MRDPNQVPTHNASRQATASTALKAAENLANRVFVYIVTSTGAGLHMIGAGRNLRSGLATGRGYLSGARMPIASAMGGRLSAKQTELIETQVATARKSATVAYLLWLFLGVLGVHNLYLGWLKLGLFQAVGAIFSLLVLLGDEGPLTMIAIVVGTACSISLLIDPFLIPSRVHRASDDLRRRLTATLMSNGEGKAARPSAE